MKKTSRDSAARQVAKFIGRYDPAVARQVRSARKILRRRLPTAIEQVYDGYNFLALGFCTTERTSDCIVSLAASPKEVALSFYHGASLADPAGILLGSGKQNRYVRLEDSRTLSRPAIEALLCAAIEQAKPPCLSPAGATRSSNPWRPSSVPAVPSRPPGRNEKAPGPCRQSSLAHL